MAPSLSLATLALVASALCLKHGVRADVPNMFPGELPKGIFPNTKDPFVGTVDAFFALVPLNRTIIDRSMPDNHTLLFPPTHFTANDFAPYPFPPTDPAAASAPLALLQLGKQIKSGWAAFPYTLPSFNEAKISLPWVRTPHSAIQGVRLNHWVDSWQQRKAIPHVVHAPVLVANITNNANYTVKSRKNEFLFASFEYDPVVPNMIPQVPPALLDAIQAVYVGVDAFHDEVYTFAPATSVRAVTAKVRMSPGFVDDFYVAEPAMEMTVQGFHMSLSWTMRNVFIHQR